MTEGETRLSNGPMSMVIRPALGGTIARLDWTGPDGTVQHILRPNDDPNDFPPYACYPLFPFSNRIAQAKLHFDGEVFDLPVNAPPEPHCLHGDSSRHPWTLAGSDASSATLTYESDRLGPPFDYAAKQHFRLTEDALVAELSITNKGSRSMPAGFGLHPYFEKPPGTTLTANLPKVWLDTNGDLIPAKHADVPPEWSFSNGRPLDEVTVDGNFTGWDGVGRIDWPGRAMAVEVTASDELRNIVLYVPPGKDFFCFEPVSNANNAFNRDPSTYAENGVVVLQPGESFSASMTFRAVPA